MKTMLASALALSALSAPFAPALAAPPQRNVVQFNDLDLGTAAGKAALDARISAAARRVCQSESQTGTRLAANACMADIRKQVLAQVQAYQNRVGKGG